MLILACDLLMLTLCHPIVKRRHPSIMLRIERDRIDHLNRLIAIWYRRQAVPTTQPSFWRPSWNAVALAVLADRSQGKASAHRSAVSRSGCCARAGNGDAAATPPSAQRKSRRLMGPPFFCSTAPQAFFCPDRRFPTPTRAEAVTAGRRSAIAAHSDVSRPRLDSFEHGGRLGRVGIILAAHRPCPQEIEYPRLNREHPTDIKQLPTSVDPPRVERVQQVQRRCPWAHAMIASPYIRQLRYGLPLCCMHGRSREKDGAHLHNGRLARLNLRWVSPATHPTRPTPTRRSVGTVSLSSCVPRHWRVEDRALWHEANLDVTPEGYRQLACNGDDHDFPHALALTRSALNEPSGECTLRLVPDP
jgi:hypothetical protein